MTKQFSDISDELWLMIVPLLPKEKRKPRGGRPTVGWRKVIAGIVYRLRTGCQWKAIPREFASGSTCHRKFQELEQLGVWAKIHGMAAKRYMGKKNAAEMVIAGFGPHQGTKRRR